MTLSPNWNGSGSAVAELNESNNTRAVNALVDNRPSDLRVTAVSALPENFSGEETTITWTVTNQGGDVWAGTRGWIDSVYFSSEVLHHPVIRCALRTFISLDIFRRQGIFNGFVRANRSGVERR